MNNNNNYILRIFAMIVLFFCVLVVTMGNESTNAQSVYKGQSIEGIYSRTEEISDRVTGKFSLVTSSIEITKSNDSYYAKGMLWGGNFHICSITSVVDDAPLPMNDENKTLVFTVTEVLGAQYRAPYYDENGTLIFTTTSANDFWGINCKLKFSFIDDVLHISESSLEDETPTSNCSKKVFLCGVRIGLHGFKLPKTK